MNASASVFPAPRVAPHPARALAGLWRLSARRFFTLNYWLLLVGLLGALVVLSLPATPTQAAAQTGLLPWAAGFYVCFVVPLLSYLSAAGALREDFGAASVDYLLTRPVRRPLFVVFRYFTHMAATQLSFVFSLATIAALCAFWQVPDFLAALPALLLAQVCAIVTYSAIGFLCAALTSRYVIVGLLYGAVVEVGLGNVPTQLNQISLVRHILALVHPLLGEGGWAISKTLGPTDGGVATVALLLGIAAAAVALAAMLFSFREFAGSARET